MKPFFLNSQQTKMTLSGHLLYSTNLSLLSTMDIQKWRAEIYILFSLKEGSAQSFPYVKLEKKPYTSIVVIFSLIRQLNSVDENNLQGSLGKYSQNQPDRISSVSPCSSGP